MVEVALRCPVQVEKSERALGSETQRLARGLPHWLGPVYEDFTLRSTREQGTAHPPQLSFLGSD